MTPKEKAKELIEKFMSDNQFLEEDIMKWAIHFSVICVDEILNDNPNIYDSDRLNHKYWESVKEELSLL